MRCRIYIVSLWCKFFRLYALCMPLILTYIAICSFSWYCQCLSTVCYIPVWCVRLLRVLWLHVTWLFRLSVFVLHTYWVDVALPSASAPHAVQTHVVACRCFIMPIALSRMYLNCDIIWKKKWQLRNTWAYWHSLLEIDLMSLRTAPCMLPLIKYSLITKPECDQHQKDSHIVFSTKSCMSCSREGSLNRLYVNLKVAHSVSVKSSIDFLAFNQSINQ